jgi:hypothetical protein
MATVADYVKLQDTYFELQEIAGTQNFLINLPANFNSTQPGILTFMLRIVNGKNIHLTIGMGPANNPPAQQVFWTISWSGDYYGNVQELLGDAPLLNGNMLYFTRTAGTGTVKISDVVIWCQVNV